MRPIYYVGFYDCSEIAPEKRVVSPAGSSKMEYISSVIRDKGYDVEIISPSMTELDRTFPGKKIRLENGISLKLFRTHGGASGVSRILRILGMQAQLLMELLTLPQYATVLVYHSLFYMGIFSVVQKIKKFHLILEVEEVYSDVTGDHPMRNREMKFFKLAEAYLFPTELMNHLINTEQKPALIVYGTYQVQQVQTGNLVSEQFEPEVRHLIYAGTLDPQKGGAMAAVEAMRFLTPQYHLHVLGFGSEQVMQKIIKLAGEITEQGGARVTYDGTRSGKEYIQFLQSCDVGFSTQNPDGVYNDTSFPSKVLSYLANGLRVVSVRIPVLEQSEIGDLLVFSDGASPQSIAQAVQKIDFSQPYDSRARIRELDMELRRKLDGFLDKTAL